MTHPADPTAAPDPRPDPRPNPRPDPRDGLSLVYVTAPNRTEAEHLARTLVEARLAACANVLGEMQSFYWWQGAVQAESEVAVLFKTRTTRVGDLSAAIVRAHSYDCPCVVALDITAGNTAFLDWIVAETDPGDNRGAGDK